MIIYIVSHFYDNGLDYEDYRDFEDHSYYSTLELASNLYWSKVISEYEGKYVLKSVELDTQDTTIIEESSYVRCHSQFDDDDYYEENPDCKSDPMEEWEKEHYWNGMPKHPEKSIEIAWEYLSWLEDNEEEQEAINTYLNSKNTNLKKWDEVNAEIEERKNQMYLDDTIEELENLLSA